MTDSKPPKNVVNLDESVLAALREKEPSDFAKQKWKKAVLQEVGIMGQQRKSRSRWIEIAAASVVGFILGGLVMSLNQSHEPVLELAQNTDENATIEYVITKSN